MKDEEFQKIVVELGKATSSQIKTLRNQIDECLKEIGEYEEPEPSVIKEPSPALSEKYFEAESIDSNGFYEKLLYREIEQLSFYIRPAREWFIPCPTCQQKLKRQMANARWIFGNKDYEPAIELNNVKDELDEDYTHAILHRKATQAEIDRIGIDGWKKLHYVQKPTKKTGDVQ